MNWIERAQDQEGWNRLKEAYTITVENGKEEEKKKNFLLTFDEIIIVIGRESNANVD